MSSPMKLAIDSLHLVKVHLIVNFFGFLPNTETVAARLRGLWTIAPRAEGHTKLVDNKLKTQDCKTLFKNLTDQFYI